MMLQLTIPSLSLSAVALAAALRGPDVAPARSAHHFPLTHANVAAIGAPSRTRGLVTRNDSTPLYTEEQATAGAVVFGKICVECHEKKDIAGADFRAKWTGRPLFALFELIRTTMPDSNPGGLSRDEYAAALAYILKQNGLPAGAMTVMPDSAAMQGAMLSLPPQSP